MVAANCKLPEQHGHVLLGTCLTPERLDYDIYCTLQLLLCGKEPRSAGKLLLQSMLQYEEIQRLVYRMYVKAVRPLGVLRPPTCQTAGRGAMAEQS